ncbi:MAG: hypothetical protein WDW36_003038 [Sanguina aurantia]
MVYAAAFAPLSEDLSKRAFADSKTLSAEQRERLFGSIQEDPLIGYCAEILSAHHISALMLGRDRISLNIIASDSTCNIIRDVLQSGVNIKEVYIDTVGDADRYRAKLSLIFPSLHFTVCPKADALYPCVSGASIVAKVIRDGALLQCQKDLGIEGPLGTGYPHDADTKAWLRASLTPVFGFPAIVRFSWETCSRILAEQVGVTWEADEEEPLEDGSAMVQQRLTFAPADTSKRSAAVLQESSGMGRHAFFRSRKLQCLESCL